jgi:hypothetical protein
MTPETYVDHNPDVALLDEIKCRTYQLYEQRGGRDIKERLQTELPRVLYALAEVERYTKGEVGDVRSVRAALVYLRALSSVIGERDRD